MTGISGIITAHNLRGAIPLGRQRVTIGCGAGAVGTTPMTTCARRTAITTTRRFAAASGSVAGLPHP